MVMKWLQTIEIRIQISVEIKKTLGDFFHMSNLHAESYPEYVLVGGGMYPVK